MYKKFEINWTKIKGGCQSKRKVVTHNSKRKVVTHNSKGDLPLVYSIIMILCPNIGSKHV